MKPASIITIFLAVLAVIVAAIVELRSFREFAFVMTVGVLIDTFVVRTLLMPALTSLFGEWAWWPGRRVVTLSERITPRESHVLAAQLPRDLRPFVLTPKGGPERFGIDEFVRRVGEREGVSDAQARAHARAVLATLAATTSDRLAYVRAQLSDDYAPLFDGD